MVFLVFGAFECPNVEEVLKVRNYILGASSRENQGGARLTHVNITRVIKEGEKLKITLDAFPQEPNRINENQVKAFGLSTRLNQVQNPVPEPGPIGGGEQPNQDNYNIPRQPRRPTNQPRQNRQRPQPQPRNNRRQQNPGRNELLPQGSQHRADNEHRAMNLANRLMQRLEDDRHKTNREMQRMKQDLFDQIG